MANGKTQAVNQEWESLKTQIAEVTNVFGAILFMPMILLVGIAYGIRAGVIAGTEKALSMLKGWSE